MDGSREYRDDNYRRIDATHGEYYPYAFRSRRRAPSVERGYDNGHYNAYHRRAPYETPLHNHEELRYYDPRRTTDNQNNQIRIPHHEERRLIDRRNNDARTPSYTRSSKDCIKEIAKLDAERIMAEAYEKEQEIEADAVKRMRKERAKAEEKARKIRNDASSVVASVNSSKDAKDDKVGKGTGKTQADEDWEKGVDAPDEGGEKKDGNWNVNPTQTQVPVAEAETIKLDNPPSPARSGVSDKSSDVSKLEE